MIVEDLAPRCQRSGLAGSQRFECWQNVVANRRLHRNQEGEADPAQPTGMCDLVRVIGRLTDRLACRAIVVSCVGRDDAEPDGDGGKRADRGSGEAILHRAERVIAARQGRDVRATDLVGDDSCDIVVTDRADRQLDARFIDAHELKLGLAQTAPRARRLARPRARCRGRGTHAASVRPSTRPRANRVSSPTSG